jgi:hypothetical protein
MQGDLSLAAGYIFGDKQDANKVQIFVDMLLRHQVQVHELADGYKDDKYEKGKAFVVSLQQPQKNLIKAIFENIPTYKDSLFYDITAWNIPLAFGLQHTAINNAQGMLGKKVEKANFAFGKLPISKSNIGYLIEWSDYYAPAGLYWLQEKGLIIKTTTNPFEINTEGTVRKFTNGTLLIPVAMQSKNADEIFALVQAASTQYGLRSYAITSGNAITGSDPGSSKMAVLSKPTIAMIVGTGVNPLDAGEIWHLLDQRMNITATHLEQSIFNRVDINKYNTIIMVSGQYNELNKDKLKAWVQAGGTLILLEEAINWSAANGISEVKFKRIKSPTDSTQRIAYVQREQIEGAQQMNGAIFGADADLTHPLAYGYTSKTVSLFKANKVFMEKSKSPYATPFYYGSQPLQSGWVSKENGEAAKNSAAVVVNALGNGRIINIADNPNMRGFWLGGSKLVMNAIFFGRIIEAGSARGED